MKTNVKIQIAMAVLFLSPAWTPLLAKEDLPQLFVPDGQLLTHSIQVYVSATNLDKSMHPELRLFGSTPQRQMDDAGISSWKPFFLAGGQSWTENVSGQVVSREGSFMLFNLGNFPVASYKSTTRVTPVLTWNATGKENSTNMITLVGTPVYLGKPRAAAVWTLLAMATLVSVIAVFCHVRAKEHSNLVGVSSLISGPDNYMSLWRTQLVAWTLAVGGMVFYYGIIQLEVPKIPDSLVALMGMSVATGGLSAVAARSNRPHWKEATKGGNGPSPDHKPEFPDLISSYNLDIKAVVLSVPKAQMLFWTGVILVLFITKSFLTGQLWDVPWELVALTGVSQAGYVSDKALHGKPAK